jgi:hypothetical protein
MIAKTKNTEERLDEGLLEKINHYVDDFSMFSKFKLPIGRAQFNGDLCSISLLCSAGEVDSYPYKAYYIEQIYSRYRDYCNDFINPNVIKPFSAPQNYGKQRIKQPKNNPTQTNPSKSPTTLSISKNPIN